ncbi:MAG: tol-pal system protein YbgF [Gammaproteobacteria bacterium]|nr:tol-pal system protein YbgF [Gammaproteobacteria bacterium]
MIKFSHYLLFVLTSVSVTSSWPAFADQNEGRSSNLEQRVQKIERIIDNKVLVDLIQRITSLEEEVNLLRGEIESQNHALEMMKKRQRDLYLDSDRRLRELENRAGSVSLGHDASSAEVNAPEQTVASAVTGESSVSVPTQVDRAQEKAAYNKAFNFLKEGRYAKAIESFGSFLVAYPSGDYSDNARYWLGESKYVSRLYPEAIADFERVVKDHPESPKVADAKLKIGYAYYELKRWDEAKSILSGLVSEYPDTPIARLAGKRLERIGKEGH